MRRPLIFLFSPLVAGIIAGSTFHVPIPIPLTAALIVLALTLLCIRKQFLNTSLFLIFVFMFLLGFINIQRQHNLYLQNTDITQYINRGTVTLEGTVIEPSLSYPGKNVFIVRCQRLLNDKTYRQASGIIRLTTSSDKNFHYGDFIRFHTTLKSFRNFQNPGHFDYERRMRLQGIMASGFIDHGSDIVLLRKNNGSIAKRKLESFRDYLRHIIHHNAASPQMEIIEAMTLGNKSSIPDEVREAFGKTGTSHILAISGLHVGMVAATAFFFFFLLMKSSEYLMLRFNLVKLAASGAFLMVLVYAFIAGMGVTVMRATLMAFVFLLALLWGKQKDLYNTLALAGLIILFISPEALFDISFQLSFISVLTIITIIRLFGNSTQKFIARFPFRTHGIIRYLYLSMMVCAAVTIGTLPLMMYYFDRISFVTIIANLIAVPLLGILTLALLMLFILSAFFSEIIAGYFVQGASFIADFCFTIINRLAALPFSSVNTFKPNLIEILFFYLLLFFIFLFFEEKKKKSPDNNFSAIRMTAIKVLMIILVLIFTADIIHFFLKDRLSTDLHLTVIDVGQGNSSFVQFPGGSNMLIDGGGFAQSSFDVGKFVIAPFLHHNKIVRVNTVVLSHPHPDHLLGLIYIMNNFRVKNIWKNSVMVDPKIYPEWGKAVYGNALNVSLLSSHSSGKNIHGTTVDILWPPPQDTYQTINAQSMEAVNDSSLVLKITYGETRFLIPGDISAAIEKALIQSGADLKSDVLVVPHHGSRLSSSPEFIKAVDCRYAVVSAGKSNVFRHPHPSVIERYRRAGVNIFRTDYDGAVFFKTDGKTLRADTYLGRE